MDMTNLSKKQQIVVWITGVLIILCLGLNADSKSITGRFMASRTSVLSLYGFPIGLSQDGYYFNVEGPVSSSQQGLSDLIPIAGYKYHFAVVAFLIGFLFFASTSRNIVSNPPGKIRANIPY